MENVRGFLSTNYLRCKPVDQRSQTYVQVGDSASIMGHQPEAHPVVTDVDIRMVVLLLGQPGDPVDKSHRGRKIAKGKVTDDLFAHALPGRKTRQGLLHFLIGKRVHARIVEGNEEG